MSIHGFHPPAGTRGDVARTDGERRADDDDSRHDVGKHGGVDGGHAAGNRGRADFGVAENTVDGGGGGEPRKVINRWPKQLP